MKTFLLGLFAATALAGCASHDTSSRGGGAYDRGVYHGQGTSGSPVSSDSSGSQTGDTDSEITPAPESQ